MEVFMHINRTLIINFETNFQTNWQQFTIRVQYIRNFGIFAMNKGKNPSLANIKYYNVGGFE